MSAPMLNLRQKFFFNLGNHLFWIPFPSSLASSLSAWLLHPNKEALSVFFIFAGMCAEVHEELLPVAKGKT